VVAHPFEEVVDGRDMIALRRGCLPLGHLGRAAGSRVAGPDMPRGLEDYDVSGHEWSEERRSDATEASNFQVTLMTEEKWPAHRALADQAGAGE
jgi:hypothetical protein